MLGGLPNLALPGNSPGGEQGPRANEQTSSGLMPPLPEEEPLGTQDARHGEGCAARTLAPEGGYIGEESEGRMMLLAGGVANRSSGSPSPPHPGAA